MGRGCLKIFVICLHEQLVFLLSLIATTVFTEKLRDKSKSLNYQLFFPQFSLQGTIYRDKREMLAWIHFLVEKIIEVYKFINRCSNHNSHNHTFGWSPSILAKKKRLCRVWAAGASQKLFPVLLGRTWRGSEECSWQPWPALTATSDPSYVVQTSWLHNKALN